MAATGAEDQELDYLYRQIGQAVSGAGQGAFQSRPQWNFLELGRKYWADNIERIRTAVCTDWRGCEKRALIKGGEPDERIVESLADVLAAYLTGVPVILVAKLVLSKGIDSLCDCTSTGAT